MKGYVAKRVMPYVYDTGISLLKIWTGRWTFWIIFRTIILALVYAPAAKLNEFLSTALPLLLKPPAFLLLTS